MKNKLWCDLNTPKEKAEYIRSGMAWQKGIIAYAITNDVARAFEALDKLEEMERNKRNAIYTGY
jgi:hypothetical protein